MGQTLSQQRWSLADALAEGAGESYTVQQVAAAQPIG